MRIGFIGAGKVGFTLGKYLEQNLKKEKIQKNLPETVMVSGYYSRQVESAKEAAAFTNTAVFDDLKKIVCASDVLMLTVPDGRIEAVWDSIKAFDIKGKLICHCSGAMTSNIFSGVTEAGAFGYSIHPMYAISSKYESYKELDRAFFTVEGHDRYADVICDVIKAFGNECVRIDGTDKVRYHGAAVFASNLVTGLLAISQDLLMQCGFDENQAARAIRPLFLGNANAAADKGPVESLTGPVERCDTDTVLKHLRVLDGDVREAYIAVSKCLVSVAKKKHGDRDYGKLLEALNGIGEL